MNSKLVFFAAACFFLFARKVSAVSLLPPVCFHFSFWINWPLTSILLVYIAHDNNSLGLKIKVRVSKGGNAVGLTSLFYQQQFVYFLCEPGAQLTLHAAGDSGSFLEFKRGDLIELGEDSADMIQSSGWCYGLCVRTSKRGDFPAECVYILPTMTKPPPDILVLNTLLYHLYYWHCLLHTGSMRSRVYNNSHDNVYGAVIMTKVIARVHPVHWWM